jgi:hypothetical protein
MQLFILKLVAVFDKASSARGCASSVKISVPER